MARAKFSTKTNKLLKVVSLKGNNRWESIHIQMAVTMMECSRIMFPKAQDNFCGLME